MNPNVHDHLLKRQSTAKAMGLPNPLAVARSEGLRGNQLAARASALRAKNKGKVIYQHRKTKQFTAADAQALVEFARGDQARRFLSRPGNPYADPAVTRAMPNLVPFMKQAARERNAVAAPFRSDLAKTMIEARRRKTDFSRADAKALVEFSADTPASMLRQYRKTKQFTRADARVLVEFARAR